MQIGRVDHGFGELVNSSHHIFQHTSSLLLQQQRKITPCLTTRIAEPGRLDWIVHRFLKSIAMYSNVKKKTKQNPSRFHWRLCCTTASTCWSSVCCSTMPKSSSGFGSMLGIDLHGEMGERTCQHAQAQRSETRNTGPPHVGRVTHIPAFPTLPTKNARRTHPKSNSRRTYRRFSGVNGPVLRKTSIRRRGV